MNFYDADCAMVISVDIQLQLAKCLHEVHRENITPICGTQPMYLNEYLEIQQAVAQVGPLMILDVLSILPPESKSYKRMEAIGIRSVMALPYSKRSTGVVAVINPRKFTSHNSMDVDRVLIKRVTHIRRQMEQKITTIQTTIE